MTKRNASQPRVLTSSDLAAIRGGDGTTTTTSPTDSASGLPSGKRQHQPYLAP